MNETIYPGMYNDPIGAPCDSLKPSSSYTTLSDDISCPSNFHGQGGQTAPFPKRPQNFDENLIIHTIVKFRLETLFLNPTYTLFKRVLQARSWLFGGVGHSVKILTFLWTDDERRSDASQISHLRNE